MQQMPPVRRSGSRRANAYAEETISKKRRKKSRKGVIFALLMFVFVVAAIVVVSPKEPLTRAIYTTGTEDGHVERPVNGMSTMYQGLKISEIMSSNQTAVPDENGEYADWVEIWNSTDQPMSLKDVGLSDRNDSIRFLFPDVTLEADGRMIVFCSDTNRVDIGKPYHAKFKLSSVGETVYLFDPNAYLIDSTTSPIMGGDESWALTDDGFQLMSYYSPGYANNQEGFQAYRAATMVTTGALIISEIMPDPITGLRDEDGELGDWVELYNTTDYAINLDNYALSDKENKPLQWRFPQGAVVAPHSYYVVFCTGKNRADNPSGVPHTNFGLSAESDTVVLSDNHGRLVDRVAIDNIPEDCSYARTDDGTFTVHQMATPGLPNTEAGAQQMDYNLRAMNPISVYITEVMTSNASTVVYTDDGFVDWVEIYNASQKAVDLTGYGLSDNLGRGRKWQFPQGTVIQPGEYKVILCDGDQTKNSAGQPHTSWRMTRVGGEIVCLATPEGRVIDKVILPEVPANVSYGRTIGLSGFFYYDSPTPMAANGQGFTGYAQDPTFTVEPGLHYSTVYAGINIPENTQVYYTTDGSIPTQASKPYNGEVIEMNFTTVIRARAFSTQGLQPSKVLTGSYFINAYHNLPIVSLVADPYVLWNEQDGMLAAGPNVIKEGPGILPFLNTVYREVKENLPGKEGHVEYYLLDGTKMLSQGMEFGLQGQYSLDMPQKTFKLRAKSLYGESTFAAKLFEDREYTEYKAFVLRNSGNDCAWTRLVDGFQSRMLDAYGSQIIHQAWNPVVVYLNGVYWGHYNMRERVDRFFVAQHEGLSLDEADNMVIVEASGAYKYGDNSGYRSMIKKIKASDPAKNPEDLQYILDNVDVDNYFEYMALEMFVGNSDIGNLRAYRLDGEGNKWKWIFYDVDYGMFSSGFDSPKSYLNAKGMGQQKIDNTILLKLMSVPEYKDKFLKKLADIFSFFTSDKMLEILEPLVDIIEPEMPLHFARWAEEHDQMIIQEWPTSPDGAYRYWEKRVNRLRNVIYGRPTKLWGFVKDAFKLSDKQMTDYFGPQPAFPPEYVP